MGIGATTDPAPSVTYDVVRASQSRRRDSDPELLARIHAAAAQAGLGAHQARYWWAPSFNVPRGMALLILASLWVPTLTRSPVQAVEVIGWAIPLVVIGGAIVGELLYGAIQRSRRLDLFEHGLTVARRGRLQVVRYADTSVVERIIKHGGTKAYYTSYRYTLVDTTGAEFRITSRTERPTEWGQTIQNAVALAQLARAVAAVDGGQRLDFGVFWITAGQLGRGADAWSWSEILDLSVHQLSVRLVLKDRFRPVTVDIRRIPNFRLLIALIERYAPHASKADVGET
ncbi:DUF6585 family protein [Mycobacterium sp. pUA109]|uniref:DUF6585 family protein n=1 Tax=Mycobacterium sp. pUA109 TaxID=3238982 RepID=UPI00351B5915